MSSFLIKDVYEMLRFKLTAITKTKGFYPAHLRRICRAKTVIDVGVAYGTNALHHAYPNAKFILIEPLPHYKSAIEALSRRYDCRAYEQAVGSIPGAREIVVDTENILKSSFKKRSSLTASSLPTERRRVEVTTLDTIYQENAPLEPPILLKLDIEGQEIDALKGAKELLKVTDTVIAEISVARRFENADTFEDAILFMKENGFYIFDFLNIGYAKNELTPRFADIAFKHRPN